MIETNNKRYTISNKWILRKDLFFYNKYTLFNIETRRQINLSSALYCIIKIFYYNALSINEVDKYLQSKNITFDFMYLNKLMKQHHADDLFTLNNKPFHDLQNEYIPEIYKFKVPVASTPIDAEIHFTHNCNLSCPHCFQKSMSHSDINIHLLASQWLDILKQCEMMKMHTIIISGREPLFYKGFRDVMAEAINYRLSYIIMTNAMLISKSDISLFRHKNIQLSISLDGHNSLIHDIIRGKEAFKKLDQILSLLVSERVKVCISHTINKFNFKYLEELIFYLINKKIKKVSFGITEKSGRAAMNSELLLSPEEESQVYSEFNILKEKYKKDIDINFPNLSYIQKSENYGDDKYIYCSAGTQRIAIDSGGTLYPCVYAFNHKEFAIGNLKYDKIIDL